MTDLNHRDALVDMAYGTMEERAAAAQLPSVERQRRIENMLIRYPLFRDIVAAVRRIHMPVEGGTHGRGSIRGILGSPRAGKSYAISDYVGGLGRIVTEEADVPVAIHVDAAEGWSSKDFVSAMYQKILGRSPSGGLNVSSALDNIEDEIARYGTQLIVIDDAHWLMGSSNSKTVKDVRGFITRLATRKCCNIILVGPQELYGLVAAGIHAHGRGGFPRTYIEPYDWYDTSPEGGRDLFKFLLDDIDERLPFAEPSDLADDEIAAHLYKLSGGLVGLVMNYVQDAAFAAINDGSRRVELRHLRQAAQERRRPGDPYEPFSSLISQDDPMGTRAADDTRKTEAARPSLRKTTSIRRGKKNQA